MSDTKRKMLTPEERVAKLEAELKAARDKAEAKANRRAAELWEQRSKLLTQVEERTAKINAIDAELAELGHEAEAAAQAEDADDSNVVDMRQSAEG